MVLSVGAAELLASREAGGGPVTAAVLNEEESLLPVHVALHRAADHRPSSGQVLQDHVKTSADAVLKAASAAGQARGVGVIGDHWIP